ncbi:hypothetical protein, partial [Desulfosporosinus sp. FKA]|uniref:hypothetical protein n=1 Tax=Desulfosporosinus sp. FKA TaxID=1969834 RepID=UPI001A9A5A81
QRGEKLVRFSYTRTRKLRIHTAGVCVWGRSVAKGSSAFRSRANNTWGAGPWESRSLPGEQATDCHNGSLFVVHERNERCWVPHCRRRRCGMQRGEKLVLRHEVNLWGWWLGETLHWRLSCLSCSDPHCGRIDLKPKNML